jgi:hypothetical protein
MLVAAALLSLALGPTCHGAILLYSDDFESYQVGSLIDGQGAWVNNVVLYEFYVENHPLGVHDGNFLMRGGGVVCNVPGESFATVHLTNAGGFDGLTVGFEYVLQLNENAMVEISPDNTAWTDVTSEFGLVQMASNDTTWPAFADLSDEVGQAGLQTDLYLRFTAWDPSGAGDWHWFGIDNLRVEIPEPATLSLFGVGIVGLGLRSRNSHS